MGNCDYYTHVGTTVEDIMVVRNGRHKKIVFKVSPMINV